MLIEAERPLPHEGLFTTPLIQIEADGEEPRIWKGKGKEISPEEASDAAMAEAAADGTAEEIDWTTYEAPAGLLEAPDVSEVITKLVHESVEKIKARIIEEEERRKEAEEAERLRREEEQRREQEKAKASEEPDVLETGVPEISVTGDPSIQGWQTTQGASLGSQPGMESPRPPMEPMGYLTPDPAPKSKKRSIMALFRRVNRRHDKGETSAAGALRHRPNPSLTSIDLDTAAGRRRMVLDMMKKVSSPSPTPSSDDGEEETVECVSCLDDFDPKETIRAPCHNYCRDCFVRLITSACENEQHWPPKCCLNNIPEATINQATDQELQRRYRDRAAEWNIPVSDRVYCSQPECSLWIRTDQINHALNVARCTAGHWTCTLCRGEQHDGEDCPQDRDLAQTTALAEEEGWRRCISCRAYVEHREACQHMTCRCGAEFCYVCGLRWRTCGCTMEQLNAIKTGAETRRQARIEREAQEEYELQEALRQIEEFEREEARKAELLRLERERLAEERRQKELEERIRREGARRRAVELKYQEFREILANLHDIQRVRVSTDHSKEAANMKHLGAVAKENLNEKQKIEREQLYENTNRALAEEEATLDGERELRISDERLIEERYMKQLKSYWGGKRGGELQIEHAMHDLKRKMDKGFQAWDKWAQNKLETFRYHTEEEQHIHEELMENAVKKLNELLETQLTDFVKKKAAQLKWVEVAIQERDAMLTEMEVEEIENGEDIDSWFAEPSLDDGSTDGLDPEHMEHDHHLHIPGAYTETA